MNYEDLLNECSDEDLIVKEKPLQLFVLAFKHGCHGIHETAEFLEVSEEFLTECVKAYYDKYGPFLELNGYLFMFSETGLNISKTII